MFRISQVNNGDSQAHRQGEDRINVLSFFQNIKSRVKIVVSQMTAAIANDISVNS
jgi:hypothetical protein